MVARQYDLGQTVAASFSAPTLFTIAKDLTKMQVQADVDQSDIGQIKVGEPVQFTVDAYPDQPFRGQISQVRLNATVTQNVITYPVIVEVPNPDLKLRPSMTANVRSAVATVRDALRVPNSALRFRPETGRNGSAARPATQPARRRRRRSAADRRRQPAISGQARSLRAAPPGRRSQARRAASGRPRRSAGQHGRRSRGSACRRAEMAAGRRRQQGQTVYVLNPATATKTPAAAVQIRAGITDGHYTQVLR